MVIRIPCAVAHGVETIYDCVDCFTHHCAKQAKREHAEFFAGNTDTHALDGCPTCKPYRAALKDADGYTGTPAPTEHGTAVCKPLTDADGERVCTRTVEQQPCGECEPPGPVAYYYFKPVAEISVCNLGFEHHKTVGYTYWAFLRNGEHFQLSPGQYENRMR